MHINQLLTLATVEEGAPATQLRYNEHTLTLTLTLNLTLTLMTDV